MLGTSCMMDSSADRLGIAVWRAIRNASTYSPAIVNGGGKVDHMGGSIVGLRRWKTVPPACQWSA